MPTFRIKIEDADDGLPECSMSYIKVMAVKMKLLDETIKYLGKCRSKLASSVFMALGRCLNKKMTEKQSVEYMRIHGMGEYVTRKSQRYDLQKVFDVINARLSDLETLYIIGLAPLIWMNDTGAKWCKKQVVTVHVFFQKIDVDSCDVKLLKDIAGVFEKGVEMGCGVEFK